jgi:predicted enzyme related to lactoylglutathione lyase
MPTDRPAPPRLIATTVDCHDLEAMTAFWGGLLEVETAIEEPYGFLAPSDDRRVTMWLQRVGDEFVGKNRVHVDLVVEDLDAAVARVEELGGASGDLHRWHGYVWRTCADPEGNLFDIMQAQAV